MYSNFYPQNDLIQKMNDVFSLEPNDLGSQTLTRMYKFITSRLKSMPFFYIIPLSGLGAILMYLSFGHLVVKLVSILQYGF